MDNDEGRDAEILDQVTQSLKQIDFTPDDSFHLDRGGETVSLGYGDTVMELTKQSGKPILTLLNDIVEFTCEKLSFIHDGEEYTAAGDDAGLTFSLESASLTTAIRTAS